MIHNIKIQQCFLVHILEGRKTFEVRKNDRDYQVGDIISFLPIQDEDYNAYKTKPIPEYRITYVTNFGCQDGYVVFGIEEQITNLSTLTQGR